MSSAIQSVEAVARTYLTFARAFDYPRADFWDQAEGKRFGELMGEVRGEGTSALDSDAVIPHGIREERESEYLSAFELGAVPLYEGLHRASEGREGILEELLRFYLFFDLKLREDGRDYPDHLVTELEFMGYLASREAGAMEAGVDPSPYRRAQRDFLARHLGVWAPSFEERIAARLPSSIYRSLGGLLAAFIGNQRKRLDLSLEGDGP